MILHHITADQLAELERTFAVFTPQGWALPEWLVALRNEPYELVKEIPHEPQ